MYIIYGEMNISYPLLSVALTYMCVWGLLYCIPVTEAHKVTQSDRLAEADVCS